MNNIQKLIFKTQTEGGYYSYNFSTSGASSGGLACGLSPITLTLYSPSSSLIVGTILFSDTSLTMVFDGNNLFWNTSTGYSYRISELGVITAVFECNGILFRYKRDGSQQPEDPEFHMPYVDYIDVDGNPQREYLSIDTDDCSEIYGLSIVETRYAISCD